MKKNGEINYSALPGLTAGIITDMAMMITGGGMASSVVKGTARVGSKVTGALGRTIGITPKNFPKLYGTVNEGKYLLGKIASSKQIADRAKMFTGSVMVMYPKNLQEAMYQIDDNFTAEDAVRSSYVKSFAESAIELLVILRKVKHGETWIFGLMVRIGRKQLVY